MKKTMWIAMVGAFAASIVAASAQEVLSANAVGYIKKTLPADAKFIMVSVPLESMTETDTVFGRTSLAQEAPQGSMVYFWNVALQQWDLGNKTSKGWAAAQSNRVVAAGEGFFLKGSNAAPTAVDVTITGEVPDTDPLVRAIPGSGAYGTLANAYPVDMKFGESDVAKNASQNSIVLLLERSPAAMGLGQQDLQGLGGCSVEPRGEAGEGFFLREMGTVTTWTKRQAYTWP
jgi:hypothetical protein